MFPVDVFHGLHELLSSPAPRSVGTRPGIPATSDTPARPKVRPHPVLLFIDLVRCPPCKHTCSKSLISSLHLRIHQQPDFARRRTQLRVRQVDSLPHARVRLRHPVFHLHRSSAAAKYSANHLVVRRPRGLLLRIPMRPRRPPPRRRASGTASETPRMPASSSRAGSRFRPAPCTIPRHPICTITELIGSTLKSSAHSSGRRGSTVSSCHMQAPVERACTPGRRPCSDTIPALPAA